MISVSNVSVAFGGFTLLDSISFLVNKRDRIGLTGRNGAGKSTLLKILAGVQEPTSGSVSMPSDLKIGYLPQTKVYAEGKTVRDEAKTAFNDVLALRSGLERMHEELANRTDYESASYMKLIDKINAQTELLRVSGVDNMEGEVEVVLKGLGFRQEDMDRRCEEFSGGWRMRIELAKIIGKNIAWASGRVFVGRADQPFGHRVYFVVGVFFATLSGCGCPRVARPGFFGQCHDPDD